MLADGHCTRARLFPLERAGQLRAGGWNRQPPGNRFGLIYGDFKMQKRTPKLSAEWFREASRRSAVV
jgi:hypothetical protein